MTLNVINRRNPGTLCQAEVVYEYGVAHAHAIKWVAAQRRHFYARIGRINSKGRVQHGRSPAVGSLVYRHQLAKLEAFPPYLFKKTGRNF